MRTMLVNPLRATKTIHRGELVRGKVATVKRKRRAANPPSVIFAAANPKRRRRRNAMLMNPSSYANPLILPNRRRRRKNPFHPATSLKGFFMVAGTGLLAGGVGYFLDKIAIQKLGIQTNADGTVRRDSNGQPMDTSGGVLLRNVVRLGIGGLAAYLFPGAFGAGVTGALGYPIFGALEAWWRRSSSTANADEYSDSSQPQEQLNDIEAELHDLEAELNDVLEAA